MISEGWQWWRQNLNPVLPECDFVNYLFSAQFGNNEYSGYSVLPDCARNSLIFNFSLFCATWQLKAQIPTTGKVIQAWKDCVLPVCTRKQKVFKGGVYPQNSSFPIFSDIFSLLGFCWNEWCIHFFFKCSWSIFNNFSKLLSHQNNLAYIFFIHRYW